MPARQSAAADAMNRLDAYAIRTLPDAATPPKLFLQARGLHRDRPFLQLLRDQAGEVLGRATERVEPLGLEKLLRLGRPDRLVAAAVELLDHVARRAGGRPDREPQRRLDVRRTGLDHGRQVR